MWRRRKKGNGKPTSLNFSTPKLVDVVFKCFKTWGSRDLEHGNSELRKLNLRIQIWSVFSYKSVNKSKQIWHLFLWKSFSVLLFAGHISNENGSKMVSRQGRPIFMVISFLLSSMAFIYRPFWFALVYILYWLLFK